MLWLLAHLRLNTTANGGRTTPIFSGYRTDFIFKRGGRIAIIFFDKKLLFPGEECLVVCGIMEHTLLEHGEDDRSNLLKYPTAQIISGSHIVGYIDIKGFIDDEKEMPFPLRDAYNNG